MQHFTNYCYIFNHTNYCYRYNHIYTLCLKSLWPLASVWSKITLNTGNMCGARADPQTLKMRRFFSYVFGTLYANFQQFPKIWSFGRNSQTKVSTFIVVKSEKFCLRVCHEAPFDWKFLEILEVNVSTPALPLPHCCE